MEDKSVINKAYEDFMTELFGYVPEDVASRSVLRSEYTKIMKRIQKHHGLKQGHPDFAGWIFTLIGNSPIIIEDEEEEGAEHNESIATS